ncbi:MAG TPA: 50S ribosomal protein L32e [Candidatus Sulfotelmatobacter sp.]|nr:50S ribosomal protein L32e [Candidatus Sulfotelmatobacter sp.]
MTERKPVNSRKLLKLREQAKHKKPEFLRSESWRYSKMSKSWRRPRGLDHKMRRKIKGWPPMVSTGYKGPKIARGLHPSGLREVLVHNIAEICAVDPEIQAARIAGTVGKKKRALMLAEAKKKKIRVLNPGIEETSEVTEEEPSLAEEEISEVKSEKPRRRLFNRRKPSEDTESKKKETTKRARKSAKTTEATEAAEASSEETEGVEEQ